jgi:hypothetical protein
LKRIVSISLGSSKRDKSSRVNILGEEFLVERIGVDGDLRRFQEMFARLDGEADALGVGGADLYLWIDHRRYTFRQIQRLVSGAKRTPVVDGSGLKNTLERRLIHHLNEHQVVPFAQSRVLLTMAVDRFGMAKALTEVCPNVVFGDAMFGIGVPLRIRSYAALRVIGKVLLPIITRLPFQWFYPTGEKQDERKPKFEWAFREADVICGDWHYIRRYCPENLSGKTIITNTLRKDDIEFLARSGAKMAITSTPKMDGESFGTNVMEGVLVALLGKRPEELTANDYNSILDQIGWQPNVYELSSPPSSPT